MTDTLSTMTTPADPELAQQLAEAQARIVVLEHERTQLIAAYTDAQRAAESAEIRRKMAWARRFSARRAAVWMIGTIQQQYQYEAWRPADVAAFLADLAAMWEPAASELEFRRAHAPISQFCSVHDLGFNSLYHFDQWEAIDLALAVVPFMASAAAYDRTPVLVQTPMDVEISDEQAQTNANGMQLVLEALRTAAASTGRHAADGPPDDDY